MDYPQLTDRRVIFCNDIDLYRKSPEKVITINDPINLMIGNLSNQHRIGRHPYWRPMQLNKLHSDTRKRNIHTKIKKRCLKLNLSEINISNIEDDLENDLYSMIGFKESDYSKNKPKFKEISGLYNIHDELTDKQILGIITDDEKVKLEKIRTEMECYSDEKKFTDLYEDKINKYQELLKQIKELKKQLKKNG